MLHWFTEPTPESIANAKHAMWEERAEVERKAGVTIGADGRVVATIIHCPFPGCQYHASAISEGRAIRLIAAHAVKAHHWPRKES